MHSYGYKFAGFFMEYGPITAGSQDAAKSAIRKLLGIRRLPRGFKVWDLSERPLACWRFADRAPFAPVALL